MQDINARLSAFIEQTPTCFQAVENFTAMLTRHGFKRLSERDAWRLKPGKYFVTRAGSALIAFCIGSERPRGFQIVASHDDSPGFKLKARPNVRAGACTVLDVEGYGGMNRTSWFDRPLSIAGRLIVEDNGALVSVPVNIARDLLVIASLAVHLGKTEAPGIQKDLRPLYAVGAADVLALAAEAAGVVPEAVRAHDLFLYSRTAPARLGRRGEFLAAPRLDDLQCAFCSVAALLESEPTDSVAVAAVFNNEEVGSLSRSGAASTFLADTLRRIAAALGGTFEDYVRMTAQSFMLSADNAHALHPNYPEKYDADNAPVLGGGVVLKYSANQKYTTDALSAALTGALAEDAGVPLQTYTNHADLPGGSTLGNLSSAQVPVLTADIGVAQLAMHSAYEICAAEDTVHLFRLMQALYAHTLNRQDGRCRFI